MSKCPSCKSGCKKRISKSSLFKILLVNKIYKCNACKVNYIKIPFLNSSIIIKKGL